MTSAHEILAFRTKATDAGLFVPEGYTDFLSVCNGFNLYGFLIYGTDDQRTGNPRTERTGFVEANQIWRDNGAGRVVYAEHGDDLLVWSRARQRFEVQDRVSTDPYESYADFDAMLEAAFADDAQEVAQYLEERRRGDSRR